MKIFGCGLPLMIMSLLSLTAWSVPFVEQQIWDQIFNQYKIYMIYVSESADILMESYFNQFCQNGSLCAKLDKSVENYETILAFIGQTKKQYFLIIDAARKQKYVMPIIEGVTAVDIQIFQANFQIGELIPFEASEEPEKSPYAPCRKIVSKDLSTFLKQETPIKVIYLYTAHNSCQVCGEMLRLFADLAERMYDPEIVVFGYYDVFKNDNPLIPDQAMSHFLIFVNEGTEPYRLDGSKMGELYEKIVDIIMRDTELDVEKYRKLTLNNQKQEDVQPPSEQIQENEEL